MSSKSSSQNAGAKGEILNKVEMTVTTYPDLQPFLEMMIVLFEGIYEHAHEVGTNTAVSVYKAK